MSSKNQVMDDKYATKASTFTNQETLSDLERYQQMEGFSSKDRIQLEEQLANKPETLIQRKLNRIFGAVGSLRNMFFNGFKMGFIVGGVFGGLMGLYYSVVYR